MQSVIMVMTVQCGKVPEETEEVMLTPTATLSWYKRVRDDYKLK